MKLSDLFTQFIPRIMDDWKEDGGCLVAGPHTLPPSTPQQVSLNWYHLMFYLKNKLIYLMATMRGYTVFYWVFLTLWSFKSFQYWMWNQWTQNWSFMGVSMSFWILHQFYLQFFFYALLFIRKCCFHWLAI